MLKRLSRSIFCAVVYIFSSAMLILSLLVSIRITAMWDEVTLSQQMANELEKENAILLNEYESRINLKKIEEYATGQLGMCRCTRDQIEYIYVK